MPETQPTVNELAPIPNRPPVEGYLPRTFYAPIEMEDGSALPVHELLDRFWSGECGQHMRTQPLRYSKDFPYERGQREQALSDLGWDLDPVGHQWEAARYVSYILEDELVHTGKLPEGMDESDIGLIVFAMGIHDIGEDTHESVQAAVGAAVGDIPFGRKTDADRAVEAGVRAYRYRTLFPDVSPKIIERIENIISHKDDSVLHDIYEAAHHLQSLATGLRAEEVYQSMQQPLARAAITGEPVTVADLIRLNSTAKLNRAVSDTVMPLLSGLMARFAFARTFVGFHGIQLEPATPAAETAAIAAIATGVVENTTDPAMALAA